LFGGCGTGSGDVRLSATDINAAIGDGPFAVAWTRENSQLSGLQINYLLVSRIEETVTARADKYGSRTAVCVEWSEARRQLDNRASPTYLMMIRLRVVIATFLRRWRWRWRTGPWTKRRSSTVSRNVCRRQWYGWPDVRS